MKAGWKTKTLGELCRIRTGKKDVNQGNPDGEYPFFTCAAEHTYSDSFSFDTEALLIAGNGDVGKVSYYTGKFEAYQRTYVISDFVDVLPRFLYLILDGKLKDTVSKQKLGNTMPYIKVGMLTDFPLPLPTFPEQQRIVAILDEAYDGIATAKTNTEKNLQNARALFESHLQSVFTQRGEGWVEMRLCEVAENISTGPFGTMLHKSDYVPDGIPLVNPMNIVDLKIVPSNRMMVNEETRDRLKSYILRTGDIVIGRRGELGRCALVTEREAGWLCGTGSFFVRLSAAMDGEFFVAVFGSEQFKARLEASAVGSTMSSLNHGILNDLVLPVPPVTVQREIMALVHDLLSETQRLESIYRQKLAALDELKKSLLDQAFTGAL
jgi:type I restriction enzyme S subunit